MLLRHHEPVSLGPGLDLPVGICEAREMLCVYTKDDAPLSYRNEDARDVPGLLGRADIETSSTTI